VQRAVVVWCPDLLEEQDDGRRGRAFGRVMEAVGTFSPTGEMVRAGVCVVGTRGPSRYFGGDERFAELLAGAVGAVDGVVVGAGVTVGVGVADGLFAAALAARHRPGSDPVVVAVGGTPEFLAPWPVATLERPELADLLGRLGIHTLGRFAALPGRDVLARFGVEGEACHRVARGVEGELPGFRLSPRRPPGRDPGAGEISTRQPAFWGGEAGAAARAGRALARIQQLVGPEAVVSGRLQGGRGPAERARVVPWSGGRGEGSDQSGGGQPTGGGRRRGGPEASLDPPWPGQVPPPAPVIVLARPLPAQLVDSGGHAVGVSGGGMVTAAPGQLSIDGGPWTEVTGWAGPWPSDERWWSVPRRQARMQVVTSAGNAHLLTRERGGWWLEGTYD
jgi:hypothetical protein